MNKRLLEKPLRTSKTKLSKKAPTAQSASKRTYLKQTDVPSASLDEALRLPTAIFDHYAGKPTLPLFVAKALNIDPKGSQLIVLSGASIAFGLTEGGAQAATIAVTELARRILRPTEENADLAAKREAVLKPRIFGEFLRRYDGNPFPRQDIALNILEEMGVPREKANEVLERIESSAQSVGFLQEIKGKKYVSLEGSGGEISQPSNAPDSDAEVIPEHNEPIHLAKPLAPTPLTARTSLAAAIIDDERRRKVFITHGRNQDFVDPIKKLLEYGELIPIVSVERQSVSKPVPEKVMEDMRICGAAIIHVDADKTIADAKGEEHVLLNPNVLIEIGAAMAFYGRRFILLVRDGVKLPSNLQGLYEVRYSGETLDATATIKLLEAIKDIKNHALPSDKLLGED
ncbi:MAG: TIR domain-containing protein [Rhizomicrobium sp.]